MQNNRMISSFRLLVLCFILLFVTSPIFAEDDAKCMSCHQYENFGRIDENGVFHNYYIDAEKFQNSIHGTLTCTACHGDITNIPHNPKPVPVDCGQACHLEEPFSQKPFSHSGIAKSINNSIHGKKGNDNDKDKPVCKSCHVNHVFKEYHENIVAQKAENCMACHEGEQFSVALRHIEVFGGDLSYWNQKNKISICVNCHANADIQRKTQEVGEIDEVASFLKTFHGVGYSFGDEAVPVCSDCHSYHNVFPQSDVRSKIHPLQLSKTCTSSGCHEGASDSFISGSMHFRYTGYQAKILKYIRLIWTSLIIGVIGFMILHNFADFFRSREHIKKHGYPKAARAGKAYLRLTKAERVSHIIMFVTFTLLAISGAMLWLPRERMLWLPQWFFQNELRNWIHRIAAIGMFLVSFYHIGYAIFTKRGRFLLFQMFPKLIDATTFMQNMMFLFRLRSTPPKFGHFNYSEKMEYWAFAWGSFVMGGTGIILWFENLGPKFWVDVSRLIHSLEAILAVLAIVVWHFYLVHWKPGKWPMSNAWITGVISEDEMKEEHLARWEELEKEGEES